MIRKIAFKNARRNSGDYVIYAITMIFAIAILYSFMAVFPQAMAIVDEKIAETNFTSLRTLNVCLIICSVLIGLAFIFLIIYANGFFLKQRKKELGLYLLLGLDKKQVSCILILESSLATIVSFIIGLVLGIGVSQLLGLFTSTMFYGNVSAYKFYISLEALGYSAIFFFIL